MQLIEVQSRQDESAFLRLPLDIYRNDPNWIRPLDKDIRFVFDRSKNKFFQHGELIRWILKDGPRVIGRVAAFINNEQSEEFEQPTGGLGFFEVINDQLAANQLFDACKDWLAERGMEAMDGPINFGEKNNWWGLLIEGFTPPTYGMNYHPHYYQNLFERYGFQQFYKQLTYGLHVDDERPEHYKEKASEVLTSGQFTFRHLVKADIEKYAADFRQIYNEAWGRHHGFKEMSQAQAWTIMQRMKPILVEDLMWFGYHGERPVAFFIMLPELNQYFKHVRGRLDLLGKLSVGYHRWRKSVRKVFGIVFGVVPDFQGQGVESAIIMASDEHLRPQNRWDEIELAWIGDFNPKMHHIADNLGARIVKVHATYRKLFDDAKPFHRHPILE